MSRRRPHQNDNYSDEEGKASNFNKRRKTSETTEEIEKRLESLICRLGEKSTSSLESNLEGLALVLEADLNNFKPQILQILVLCSYQLPEKCSIYATLVGLLNAKKFNCGSDYLELLLKELKRLIVTNQYEYARYAVRFLGDLVNCNVVTTSSMMSLLDTFVMVAKQEGVPQLRKDWYIYATLSTLPWCGGILYEKKFDEMEELFSKIGRYIQKRSKDHHSFLRVWSQDDPHPQEEYLDCLFAQIQKLRDDKWVEDVIIRPYRAFEPTLAEAMTHNLPDFIVPPHIEGQSVYPLPQVVYRMFDYTDCPEGPLMPGNHAIDRWLFEENMRSLIDTHRNEKKECAAVLLSLPGHQKIPLNHMIIECLFGDLFRLPTPPRSAVFYTCVFIELCKLEPVMMPQVLALASDMLYERIDTMNITCVDRLISWFSHHLSNFQFRWSWEEWSDCLNIEPSASKPKFISEVLERCMRLSYCKRVSSIVPERFAPLLPQDPVISFKYAPEPGKHTSPEEYVALTASQRVIESMKRKCKDDEVIMVLEEVVPGNQDQSESTYNLQRLEVFLNSVLFLAQKSFSHSFSALSKFHKVIKWASDGDEGKVETMRITKEVWSTHPQMMVVLIDKMLRLQIVDCASVAKWLFSPQMASDFTRSYAWEIMHSAIRKMNKHVSKLEMDQREMLERSHLMERKTDDVETDMMGAYDLFAPNQGDLDKIQEQVDAASSDQKKLFLIIFQRFIMILQDHLVRCEKKKIDFNSPWYRSTIQRLQEVFILHREIVSKYKTTMQNLLFTEDLDSRILNVFKQFVSVSQ